MRFTLGEENCLADYFRLYRSYCLSRLTLNEDTTLSFNMKHSNYEESKTSKISEKDRVYPAPVIQLLAARLISSHRR